MTSREHCCSRHTLWVTATSIVTDLSCRTLGETPPECCRWHVFILGFWKLDNTRGCRSAQRWRRWRISNTFWLFGYLHRPAQCRLYWARKPLSDPVPSDLMAKGSKLYSWKTVHMCMSVALSDSCSNTDKGLGSFTRGGWMHRAICQTAAMFVARSVWTLILTHRYRLYCRPFRTSFPA